MQIGMGTGMIRWPHEMLMGMTYKCAGPDSKWWSKARRLFCWVIKNPRVPQSPVGETLNKRHLQQTDLCDSSARCIGDQRESYRDTTEQVTCRASQIDVTVQVRYKSLSRVDRSVEITEQARWKSLQWAHHTACHMEVLRSQSKSCIEDVTVKSLCKVDRRVTDKSTLKPQSKPKVIWHIIGKYWSHRAS